MATTEPHEYRRTDAQPVLADDETVPDDETRHCREDAVDAKTFERLVESTYRMDEPYGQECRFLLFVCGRLGLRSGELTHLDESWIDYRRSMLCIPRYDHCGKGRDGGICGQCRENNLQKVNLRVANHYAQIHAGLSDRDELEPGGGAAADVRIPVEEFHDGMWVAKSDAGAREIPFDSIIRADIEIERFFDQYDAWPVSQTGVTRRVNRIVDHVDCIDDHDDLYRTLFELRRGLIGRTTD